MVAINKFQQKKSTLNSVASDCRLVELMMALALYREDAIGKTYRIFHGIRSHEYFRFSAVYIFNMNPYSCRNFKIPDRFLALKNKDNVDSFKREVGSNLLTWASVFGESLKEIEKMEDDYEKLFLYDAAIAYTQNVLLKICGTYDEKLVFKKLQFVPDSMTGYLSNHKQLLKGRYEGKNSITLGNEINKSRRAAVTMLHGLNYIRNRAHVFILDKDTFECPMVMKFS